MKRLIRSLSPVQKAVLILYAFLALLTFFAPPMARADDCLSDPLNAADCMRTPGYRQAITIIFSGLPAIAAILPNLTGGAAGTQPPSTDTKPPEQPDEKPTIHYVVQVSSQSVTVKPEEGANLALKAWKSVAGAPWTPAPEVQISLALSPAGPHVHVTPQRGSGEMRVDLTADEDAQPGLRTLTVVGVAPAARTSAQVQVDVQTSPYRLQTSADRIEITVGETVDLDVRTQRRREDGMWADEPDARIRPWLPTERDYFEWSPPPPYTKGANELYGHVVMRITAVNAEKPSELCYLSFTAIFPDRTEIDKRVEIILKAAEYEIEFL